MLQPKKKKLKQSLYRSYEMPNLTLSDNSISPLKGFDRIGHEKVRVQKMKSDEFLRLYRMSKPCFIRLYSILAFLDKKFISWAGDSLIDMAYYANTMWEEEEFLTYFQQICTDNIPFDLENQEKNRGTNRIPLWQMLLSLLAFFGHGSTEGISLLNFRISSFYGKIDSIMKILNISLRKTISFPFENKEKMKELALDAQRCYLKGCIGSIDGMHVPILVFDSCFDFSSHPFC